MYEHQATVLSQPIEAKRGLLPQPRRQVIDWNGAPATAATSLGVGVSVPRMGRYTMRRLSIPAACSRRAAARASASRLRCTSRLTPQRTPRASSTASCSITRVTSAR